MDSQNITPAALSRAMIKTAPPAEAAGDFAKRIKDLSLSELTLERTQMHRLGLTNLVHELDDAIERRRKERRKEREGAELALVATRRAEVVEKRDADLAALRAGARAKRDRAEAEAHRHRDAHGSAQEHRLVARRLDRRLAIHPDAPRMIDQRPPRRR